MQNRRFPWSFLIGALLFLAMLSLIFYSWPSIYEAGLLVGAAQPGWLALSMLAIVSGFLCAGQIYGRVLRTLGYHAPQLWLTAAALVSILISQAIPAGTLASYTFLTASLRRRGVPATSVALLASVELLTWIGGMLVLFSFGLIYKLLHLGGGGMAPVAYPAVAVALTLVGGFSFAATRPRSTLHRWVALVVIGLGRLLRRSWPEALIHQIVDELDTNRRLVMERPRQMLGLLFLQVLVFSLHGLALLLLLRGLGVVASSFAVLAAYGLALIVSTFTALPGGGGTVEAAIAFSLTSEGLPAEAAIGATILFRLFSFWLLLPLGALCYRLLTAGPDRRT